MGSLIYLDNHSTTPVDGRVAATVMHHMTEEFGNPSSVDHASGDSALHAVERAVRQVKSLTDAHQYRVVFTSGSTESINLALRGYVSSIEKRERADRRVRIGLTTVEHPAVTETCRALESEGRASLTWFSVDGEARLNMDELATSLRVGLDLVCIMAANNVVGTIYPIEHIARLARQHGTPCFVDATQAIGHIVFSGAAWGISAFVLSGHKFYGPKGVGALVIASDFPIAAQFSGGAQQHGLRPGTLNVPGIAGLGRACELRELELRSDSIRIRGLRDRLQDTLRQLLPEVIIFGDQSDRLPGNLSFAIPEVPNAAIIARVRNRLCIATGAACSSGIEQPSPVLRAMGIDPSVSDGHVRVGVGKFNDSSEIEEAAILIAEAVRDIQGVIANA